MQLENNRLKVRVAEALTVCKTESLDGLVRFSKRFENQDQVICLLTGQLSDLQEKYQSEPPLAGNDLVLFHEQITIFKTDLDRVVLLFSRLKILFDRCMEEHFR